MQTGETTMFHTLNLFLAPGASPGLDVEAANRPLCTTGQPEIHSGGVSQKLKFHLSVVGNALGLLLLAAGAGLSLVLLQAFMVP
jgi:hypothetical protein